MRDIQDLLLELDKLKSVYRRAYLSDGSRNENSAEHSWHLAVALLAIRDVLPVGVNVDHAIKIALLHDICEIGAGDISVYDPRRDQKAAEEEEYVDEFAAKYGEFGKEVAFLWREYEDQETLESKWVKALDRLLPLLLNLASEGRTWKEQDVSRTQVLTVNKSIAAASPEMYEWLKEEIERAVQRGWLRDA
jgi:5'-deoxynucleotidase YfbR-like HD superfamily hydrolase